jgi:type I restriction enzyme S subunit
MTDLPRGWVNASLAEICDINPRVDKSKIDHDQQVSFVPMPAVEVENGRIDVSDTRNFGSVKQGYTPFCENDVLFAKITPCMENGKMAIVPKMVNEYGFGSTEFHVLRALCGVQPRFIYHLVSNRGFRYHAEHNMTGAVGQKRVPVTLISEHPIDVPPLNEQRRIVEKIEAMFERVDKGVENLCAARTTLALYRQSLLKSAFEGRLTADWRAKNADKLEDPKTLLARIQKERDARYKTALADWQTALTNWRDGGEEGKKPAKPKRPERFELKPITIEKFATPSDWALDVFGNHLDFLTSGSRGWAKYYASGGATFIRAQNLKFDRLDLNDIAYVSLPEGNSEGMRTRVQKGDLLVTITGANVTKTAVVENKFEEAYVSQHVALCRLITGLNPRYVWLFLIAEACGRKQLEEAAYGAGKPGLNLSNINEVAIPICSPAEQTEITRILDARLDASDKMETEIDAALARAEALRQSILKRAFAGDLVPQDPTDEPASALLACIKTERAKAAKAKTAKPSQRKAAHGR